MPEVKRLPATPDRSPSRSRCNHETGPKILRPAENSATGALVLRFFFAHLIGEERLAQAI